MMNFSNVIPPQALDKNRYDDKLFLTVTHYHLHNRMCKCYPADKMEMSLSDEGP